MGWTRYHLSIRPQSPEVAVVAFLSVLAQSCNSQADRRSMAASFGYTPASGELTFHTGKTFWERPSLPSSEAISADALLAAYEAAGQRRARAGEAVFVGAAQHDVAQWSGPTAEALDETWLLCPHCVDAAELASLQSVLTCPSCQQAVGSPRTDAAAPLRALAAALQEVLVTCEIIEDDLGRLLVSLGWAQPGVLGSIEGIDTDGEYFERAYST